MLRLIHNQTVTGALLIDDIDDGLPNKQVKRMGSTANPKAYQRDGYANAAKQSCYIPRANPADATLPGFIDLEETSKVTHSAFSGKIKGFQDAGLLQIVSLLASDLATPVVTGATRNAPAAGDVTIAGTGFASVAPSITTVHLFGAGVGNVTLTKTQIVAVPPGAGSDVSIIIDSTLIAGLAIGDSIVVTADGRVSNTWIVA